MMTATTRGPLEVGPVAPGRSAWPAPPAPGGQRCQTWFRTVGQQHVGSRERIVEGACIADDVRPVPVQLEMSELLRFDRGLGRQVSLAEVERRAPPTMQRRRRAPRTVRRSRTGSLGTRVSARHSHAPRRDRQRRARSRTSRPTPARRATRSPPSAAHGPRRCGHVASTMHRSATPAGRRRRLTGREMGWGLAGRPADRRRVRARRAGRGLDRVVPSWRQVA